MPSASTWSREQVEELLRKEKFRYHRIELPHGFATAGRDRSGTAKLIFPPDLTGKSVLDLGCAEGYFCFEAKRRGASRVVGLDVESDVIRRNRLVANCLGLDVEFGTVNLEQEKLKEKFDYVLCLNVLHHLTDPLTVLDNLMEIARERLVLEMAALGPHDRRRLGMVPVFGALLSKAPIIYVSGRATRQRKLKRYFFTTGAIRNILLHHRRIYARVAITQSDHKDRYVVLAERRNIDHLILVAGPSASGQDAFIDAFMAGKMPQLQAATGTDPKAQPVTRLDSELSETPSEPHLATAIISYDILRAFMRTGSVYERDETLDILSCARKVTIVTLVKSAPALSAAYEQQAYQKLVVRWQTKRQKRIQQSYRDAGQVEGHYDKWFAYVERTGLASFVHDSRQEPAVLVPFLQWHEGKR